MGIFTEALLKSEDNEFLKEGKYNFLIKDFDTTVNERNQTVIKQFDTSKGNPGVNIVLEVFDGIQKGKEVNFPIFFTIPYIQTNMMRLFWKSRPELITLEQAKEYFVKKELPKNPDLDSNDFKKWVVAYCGLLFGKVISAKWEKQKRKVNGALQGNGQYEQIEQIDEYAKINVFSIDVYKPELGQVEEPKAQEPDLFEQSRQEIVNGNDLVSGSEDTSWEQVEIKDTEDIVKAAMDAKQPQPVRQYPTQPVQPQPETVSSTHIVEDDDLWD